MKKKYELLSPVGNFAMLNAAISGGADAIYFGLQDFNMRATAKNFTTRDLPKIRKICKKIKIYLTLNTIIYQTELKDVEKTIKAVRGKIDAIICWDLAVINLCKKHKVPFNISTQASISNAESAKFYEKLGAKKLVLARELSLKQIKDISKKTKAKIECFCHGAMCVSESGRCFMSQFLHNKSANRGECTHPCRRAYHIQEIGCDNELILENNRVMSAKDLCTLPFIEKMKEAGITSFKIEGRNRNPEYVYTVTKIYRKALNKRLSKKEIEESLEELKKVYNRGFSSGFYIKAPTSDDFTNSDSGEQTENKTFIGKIVKYWPNISVAAIRLNASKLKIGDEIYIIGEKTGLIKHKIETMQINNNPVNEATKGEEVGIKLPLCRVNDDIYLIKKKLT